jgi:hypothetical protein
VRIGLNRARFDPGLKACQGAATQLGCGSLVIARGWWYFQGTLNEADECPFCLGPMEIEDRDGHEWRVCPNGCATEYEAPGRVEPMAEVEPEPAGPSVRTRGAGS